MKKQSKALIQSIFIIALVVSWIFAGWPPILESPKFLPEVGDAYAAIGIIRPNGDSTPLQWTPSPSGSHYSTIDEIVTQPTAGTTSDIVDNQKNVSAIDQYMMETISGVNSVSAITVWVYTMCDKNASDMNIGLYYNGSAQQTNVVSVSTAYSWLSTSFTGLNLSQSQLDGLEVQITGVNGGRTYTVATLYAEVTYTQATSISLSTDGTVSFSNMAPDSTQDTTASGTNDVQTVSVDSGPATLQIRSSSFSDGSNTWSFGDASGANQVKWEFSKDGTNWSTFNLADNLYTFDTNVAQAQTRNVFFRIMAPSSTSSTNPHNATVTIVATSP